MVHTNTALKHTIFGLLLFHFLALADQPECPFEEYFTVDCSMNDYNMELGIRVCMLYCFNGYITSVDCFLGNKTWRHPLDSLCPLPCEIPKQSNDMAVRATSTKYSVDGYVYSVLNMIVRCDKGSLPVTEGHRFERNFKCVDGEWKTENELFSARRIECVDRCYLREIDNGILYYNGNCSGLEHVTSGTICAVNCPGNSIQTVTCNTFLWEFSSEVNTKQTGGLICKITECLDILDYIDIKKINLVCSNGIIDGSICRLACKKGNIRETEYLDMQCQDGVWVDLDLESELDMNSIHCYEQEYFLKESGVCETKKFWGVSVLYILIFCFD